MIEFKEKPLIIGDWNFNKYTKIKHIKVVSADTETKMFYNGNLLTDEEAYNLLKANGQSWVKENIEVKAWAFTLSDGINFALFYNIEDFLLACAMLNVKNVYWYNAKFDFSIFDYFFLTHDWKDKTEEINNKKHYGKLADKTYSSLNGEFGQRYSMQIWKSYKAKNGNICVHKFAMFDVCNIFGGGLRRNLEDWNITDESGKEVRKLKMDYAHASIEKDLPYMVADTKGLALLSLKIDETMKELTSFSLFNKDYMTAGGLSKKTLLKFMYGFDDNRKNIKAFAKDFPMTEDCDKLMRSKNLYLGGKCLVNPIKKGVVQKNIYKYDVNSMYPNQMRNMAYPFGRPQISTEYDKNDKRLKVLLIKNLTGYVKKNKIGIWQDTLTGDFKEIIDEKEERLIWEEELNEYKQWYDLFYDIVKVYYYEPCYPEGCKKFVDTFYDIKKTSKGAIKLGAKLLLNSAYGKLAQRIERRLCIYKMTEGGYVHLERGELKTDCKGMLSVLVGSRITALARVDLMRYIRLICRENVKDNFIYCDTDSVHSLTPYDDCDDTELGKMKCEGVYKYGLYIAPKSYMMYDGKKYEVHCKGVNTNIVSQELEGKNFSTACEIFTANRTFKCLSGINVKGGKALIYTDKMILNDKNYRCNKDILDSDGVLYEL